MDSSKKKFRFRLEPLDPREVPAVLGQAVELPDAAAPQAQVALTAPVKVSQDVEASLAIKFSDVLVSSRENASPSVKIDAQGLNFTKIQYGWLKVDDLGSAGPAADAASAGKVAMQDFHFTREADAGKVAMQDFHFVMKVNKASPVLF